jgi:exonuclease III
VCNAVASSNVNSIKQLLDAVLARLEEREPDVACLQETNASTRPSLLLRRPLMLENGRTTIELVGQ